PSCSAIDRLVIFKTDIIHGEAHIGEIDRSAVSSGRSGVLYRKITQGQGIDRCSDAFSEDSGGIVSVDDARGLAFTDNFKIHIGEGDIASNNDRHIGGNTDTL